MRPKCSRQSQSQREVGESSKKNAAVHVGEKVKFENQLENSGINPLILERSL
jgi:hypothetical protein